MEESAKTAYEVQKLKIEIRKLEWETSWLGRLVLSPLLAATIALTGLGIGLSNFGSQQKEQFKQRFWDARRDVYARATGAAARIANAPKLEAADMRAFLDLYWGELSILEDQQVVEAMISYREQLDVVATGAQPPSSLRNASYDLAQACRNSLKATWNPVPLYDLKQSK